jgi:hypothetical protein
MTTAQGASPAEPGRLSARGPNVVLSLAWLSATAHLVALAFTALAIAPGNPVTDLPARLNYLAHFPIGWSLGWCAWMLSAVGFVAFFAGISTRIPGHPELVRLAVVLAVSGAAIDLTCDMVQLSVLPRAAAGGEAAKALFLAVERIVGIGGTVVANAYYSVGVLLISVALRPCGPRARWAVWFGYGVFAFGMVLTLAGVIDHASLMAASGVLTILVYCAWVVLVARVLERPGASL